MEIKISPYTYGAISTKSENICDIVDKLVRLTAKLTERFASDIIYDIHSLNNAIKAKETLDRLLFFRENGVTAWCARDFSVADYDALLTNFVPIQTWRISHNPSTMETKLERVHIFKDYFPYRKEV